MSTNPGLRILPEVALDRLKEGNERFATEKRLHPHTTHERRRETLENGQQPYATILSCIDSRVPVEIIFDQGIGDLIVVRVMGNTGNGNALGSIEFSVEYLNTTLLVVIGHTDCAAVKASVNREKLHGNVTSLMTSINWAVSKAHQKNPGLTGDALLNACIEMNVWQSIEDIFKGSRIICRKIRDGELKVIGAIYDLESGRIIWLGEHPSQVVLV